jgi:hypothetical protein
MFTFTKKKVIIFGGSFLLAIGFLKIFGYFFPFFLPGIFSQLHFFPFEKNPLSTQLIVGENINKYVQIHWEDPSLQFLRKDEYPFLEDEYKIDTWQLHKFDSNATEPVLARAVDENPELRLFLTYDRNGVYVFNLENTEKQIISIPRDKLQKIMWLNNGLFVHKEIGNYYSKVDQDYFYDLEKKEMLPIQNDGQRKPSAKDRKWLLHPKNSNFLLETYCVSTTSTWGGAYCTRWGASLVTSTRSTSILSFYHTLRQQLRIGWDDDNFYVKTAKSDADWGEDEQALAQQRMNIDKAESGDQMYIIPLKNLEKI